MNPYQDLSLINASCVVTGVRGAQTPMDHTSNSNHATDSHALHLHFNFDQASSQYAAVDGSQVEIITMDSTVYKAAAEGNVHALRRHPGIDLLKQYLSPKKNSVLHIAAQFGQLDTVQWILRFPCTSSLLQQKNLKGDTPLHLAAREGHLPVVEAICDAAKQLPQDEVSGMSAETAMLRSTNKEGDTALHEAVRYNRGEMVKFLIKEDPDLSAYTENVSGGAPLYMAAERGFRKLVEVIIEDSRSSPAYSGFYGRTALHAAVIQNDSEMTKKILKWKPELTKGVDEHGWSPLHYAAYMGQTTIVKELLDESDKCVPYLRIKDGNLTALHIAAARRHMKIVETLASRYPDCCEEVDDKGNNVFHLAMMSTQPGASRDLLKNKWMRSTGLINEKNDEGNTPLHLLSSRSVNYPLVFVLGDYMDKMAVNNQKLTALDLFLMAHDACSCKDHLKKFLGGKGLWPFIGPKEWFRKKYNESSSTGSQGNVVGKKNAGCKLQQFAEFIKSSSETHLVVATLIATVAIAAGFTLPGGYDQSTGMAMLSKKASFRAFVVMDTLAMVLSVSAVFNYLFMSLHSRSSWLAIQVAFGFFITISAMGAIVVTFLTGLYAVLPRSGIPIFVCIFCCCFFLLFYLSVGQLLWAIIRRWRNRNDPGSFPWL